MTTAYEPRLWHGTLFICAVTLISAIVNLWATQYLPKMEAVFVAFHVIFFFPIVIILLQQAREKRSASAVFWHFAVQNGRWPNTGLTVLVGQVAASFILLGKHRGPGNAQNLHLQDPMHLRILPKRHEMLVL